MKKLHLVCIMLLLATTTFSQRGTVNDSYTIESKIMKQTMHYSVYFPEGYATSSRSYPVLYLLHGMFGSHTGWVQEGEVNQIASKLMACGAAPEMIIVMPEGRNDFYINNYDSSVRYEDYFFQEFMPEIEKNFPIDKASRAIAGLSMGGYGSLYYTFSRQDLFKACYAMSAAVLTFEKNGKRTDFDKNLWGPDDADGSPAYFRTHNLVEMGKKLEMKKNMRGTPEFPKIYIDCGDDDFLLLNNFQLVEVLKKKNIPFEFRVHDGAHTWDYWRNALEDALVFVGKAFRG
nr:alpha/beta hydrolase family protein [uncultured Macellibacteroides sp.]